MDADEVKRQFLAELTALLTKWNASIEAEDHWRGYAECGEDIRMEVYIPSIYENDEMVQDSCVIDLGCEVRGEWKSE
jgi:hypothetical protein